MGQHLTDMIKGNLYVLSNGLIYSACAASNLYTKRQASVLIISMDDTPIEINIKSECGNIQKIFKGHAILLAPSQNRSVKIGKKGAVFVHFDPTHNQYLSLYHWLLPDGAKIIENESAANLQNHAQEFLNNPNIFAESFFNKCANILELICDKPCLRDERIIEIVNTIYGNSPIDYAFKNLLNKTKLSPSRLSHLFTQNTGLSIRSLLQWRKIREAMYLFDTGVSLTEVAHEAGFSDSAHFCRTFKKCLGLSPSMFGPGRAIDVKIMNSNYKACN